MRLIVFFIALLITSTVVEAFPPFISNNFAKDYCPNVTNAWQYQNSINGGTGLATFNLLQTNSAIGSPISGNVTNYYCVVEGYGYYDTMTVDSTRSESEGQGAFYISASGTHCAYQDFITIPVGAAGCGTAFDNLQSSKYIGHECFYPPGETASSTNFFEWVPQYPGVAIFYTTLNPLGGDPGYSFDGRVTSNTGYYGAVSTCNPGYTITTPTYSTVPGYNSNVTGGSYTGGFYDMDTVGYTGVQYINQIRQDSSSLPCTITAYENVGMDCLNDNDTGVQYSVFSGNNAASVSYKVTGSPALLTVERNNGAQTRVYGAPNASFWKNFNFADGFDLMTEALGRF